MSETSLADTVDTDTVVTVGVGGASGSSDTACVGSSFKLAGADGVDGVKTVRLVAGVIVGSTRVDKVLVGALGLIRREGSVTVDNGTGETTVSRLGSSEASEGENRDGGESRTHLDGLRFKRVWVVT